MIVKEELVEALLLRAGDYANTSMEILKLKALDKVATISANLVSRGLLIISFAICFIFLNIALSLWLGSILGKTYYGFFAIAALYGIISTIVFLSHSPLKRKMSSFIITQMLN